MQESLEQMMQSYIENYMKSEKGRAVILSGMTSYMNQQCITQLNTFQNNATDILSILFFPYEQTKKLLLQCRTIADLLAKKEFASQFAISGMVLEINKCCEILRNYISNTKYEDENSIQMIEQIICENDKILTHLTNKPCVMSVAEFLALEEVESEEKEKQDVELKEKFCKTERADESKLRKWGYSVAQNSSMTDVERRELLKELIERKVVTKGYLISYLKYMIRINGKKESNYIALTKWQGDLEYIQNL